MKFNFTKNLQRLFTGIIFFSLAVVQFSCQKTVPQPYSNPVQTVPNSKPPAMNGYMNGAFTRTTFTPTITNSGGYITFTGTSQFYTITITFPASTGVGSYDFAFYPGFSATIYDGTNTFIANSSTGSGNIDINTITDGRYTGTFNIDGQDAALNTENVSLGVFSNL
jgi:hypothetical protein